MVARGWFHRHLSRTSLFRREHNLWAVVRVSKAGTVLHAAHPLAFWTPHPAAF